MVLRRSPTVQTLLAFVLIYVLQGIERAFEFGSGWTPQGPASGAGSFALGLPLASRPWTILLSVYAHAGVGHLLANAIALVVVGFLVEHRTTRLRFHAFFAGTGAIAGVAHLYVTASLGSPTGVLGASGAVFALLGYAVTGNRAVAPVLAWIDPGRTVTLAAFAVVAVVVVLATASPGIALVAHFVGLLAGLVAGRVHLLRPGVLSGE